MNLLQAGIIGLGVGEQHISAYEAHPSFKVRTICDNNAAKFYAAQIVLIFDYLHKQVRAPAHPLPILCSQHSRGVSTCAPTGLHLQRSQA